MTPLRIDINVDLVCPWCLIGLRNLQRARRQLADSAPDARLELRWHGVQLLPAVPAQGFPFVEFYRHRLGGDDAVRRRQAQVTAAADAAGATINYERIQVMPNTADGHRLLQLAARHGPVVQEQLLERLLCAYFERGEDIGQPQVLMAHGLACGLAQADVAAVLHGASQPYPGPAGGQGVPYFVIDGGQDLAGAQPAAVLQAAISAALARRDAVAP